MTAPLSIFLVCLPGLEPALAEEVAEAGFENPKPERGGVSLSGTWRDVWRANLVLRGASRVLVRLGRFQAKSLPALEAGARAFPWHTHLAPRVPVSLSVTCRKSRIAHAGAASQKLERALRSAAITVTKEAKLGLQARIHKDVVEISVDTSGAPLHKRGWKEAVVKAPLRETMAALFLRQAGYRPGETLLDPFCGSGTFAIEAADWASGRAAGRQRRFAFEDLPSFNPADHARARAPERPSTPTPVFAYDRDPGAVGAAKANAARAGVNVIIQQREIRDLAPPPAPPGLLICNPPYGARIGEIAPLKPVYATLGARFREIFPAWRLALVTSEEALAQATGLRWASIGPPVPHGGLKVRLYLS